MLAAYSRREEIWPAAWRINIFPFKSCCLSTTAQTQMPGPLGANEEPDFGTNLGGSPGDRIPVVIDAWGQGPVTRRRVNELGPAGRVNLTESPLSVT